MPVKWKLFCLANYIMLLVYSFLLLGAFRFTAEYNADSRSFVLFMVCLFVVILNAVFNLYLFHRHLPSRRYANRTHSIHQIISILFTFSLIIILSNFIQELPAIISAENAGAGIFFITVGLVSFVLGSFILVNQYKIRKYIEENQPERSDEENAHNW